MQLIVLWMQQVWAVHRREGLGRGLLQRNRKRLPLLAGRVRIIIVVQRCSETNQCQGWRRGGACIIICYVCGCGEGQG